MSGGVETELPRVDPPTPKVREAALRVLNRHAPDLIDMLGLGEQQPAPSYVLVGKRLRCATCWCPVRADGVCRRRDCAGAR